MSRRTKSSSEGAAFASTFVGIRGLLRRFVSRIVQPQDIDDILQETFIRAYAASTKTEIRHPRSFMLKTARNLALNHVTSAYSKRTEMEDFSDSEVPFDGATLESQFESKERFLGFCRAVRVLPDQCRRVFVLKKVYGLSQQEIADYLGISASTVEKHVAKGLLMCMESMRSMGYEVGAAAEDGAKRAERDSSNG